MIKQNQKKRIDYKPIEVMEITETSINEELLKTGCKTGSMMLSE